MKRELNVTMAVLFALVAVGGCATTGGKVTPEESIMQTLNHWKTTTEAQDVEGMIAVFSEDFRGDEGGKAEMRGFLAGAVEEGVLEGAEMDLTNVQLTVGEGVASAGPVYLSSSRGSITMILELKEDPDGVWRIASLQTT